MSLGIMSSTMAHVTAGVSVPFLLKAGPSSSLWTDHIVLIHAPSHRRRGLPRFDCCEHGRTHDLLRTPRAVLRGADPEGGLWRHMVDLFFICEEQHNAFPSGCTILHSLHKQYTIFNVVTNTLFVTVAVLVDVSPFLVT